MHFVLVVGRAGAELFSYDTSTCEQTQLTSCTPPKKIMPSMMASMQSRSAVEYANEMQRMLSAFADVQTPIILAIEKQLPNGFVKHVVDNFRHALLSQCMVGSAGQMGFNQVIRDQLTLDDVCVSVATK